MMRKILKSILFFPITLIGLIPNIKLGSPLGIPLVLTRAFILFMAWLGWLGGWKLVSLFGLAYLFVVVHEYCHAIVARKFGYKAISIALWPMSGLASIDGKFDENYKHELCIAAAGPLSNVVMAFLLWSIAGHNDWTVIAFEINVFMALFNMLPIPPMDGGRIFHSLLFSEIKDPFKTARATIIWTAVLATVITPILFMYWSPIAAMMIGFMAFVGVSEQQSKMLKIKLGKATARMIEIVQMAVTNAGRSEILGEKLTLARSFHADEEYSKAKEKCDEIMEELGFTTAESVV